MGEEEENQPAMMTVNTFQRSPETDFYQSRVIVEQTVRGVVRKIDRSGMTTLLMM